MQSSNFRGKIQTEKYQVNVRYYFTIETFGYYHVNNITRNRTYKNIVYILQNVVVLNYAEKIKLNYLKRSANTKMLKTFNAQFRIHLENRVLYKNLLRRNNYTRLY